VGIEIGQYEPPEELNTSKVGQLEGCAKIVEVREHKRVMVEAAFLF